MIRNVSTSRLSEWGRNNRGDLEEDGNSENHLPQCFAVHIFLCDPTVGERLVPHRVQRVANSLGFQFIGLCRDGREEK